MEGPAAGRQNLRPPNHPARHPAHSAGRRRRAAGAEAKLDGVDLLPYLTGKNEARPHETLYWRFGNQWAIRHGDWKLVAAGRSDPAGELYNLAEDISELKNLAADMPEKVQELQTLYDTWNAEQAPPSAPKERPNRPRRANRRAAA